MSTPKVYVRTSVDGIIDGERFGFGSNIEPVSIDIAGAELTNDAIIIAANTVVKVWDKDESGVGDFDFMLLAADRTLYVELTVDIGGEVGTALFTLPLLGTGVDGKYGLPLMLGADDAYASDYTASFAAGTLDLIERIRVKNLDTTNAAKLRRILAT